MSPQRLFRVGVPLLAAASAGMVIGYARKRRKTKLPRVGDKVFAYGERANTTLDRNFGEGSRDAIEEASWESFPASDPPAW